MKKSKRSDKPTCSFKCFCGNNRDLGTLLHVTWGSACGQPRVQRMCNTFAIRADMEEVFSADLVGAEGSAVAHASHALTHFLWQNQGFTSRVTTCSSRINLIQ